MFFFKKKDYHIKGKWGKKKNVSYRLDKQNAINNSGLFLG